MTTDDTPRSISGRPLQGEALAFHYRLAAAAAAAVTPRWLSQGQCHDCEDPATAECSRCYDPYCAYHQAAHERECWGVCRTCGTTGTGNPYGCTSHDGLCPSCAEADHCGHEANPDPGDRYADTVRRDWATHQQTH